MNEIINLYLEHKKDSKCRDRYTMSSDERTQIVKQAVTSKLIYKHMFPIKITTGLSMVIDKSWCWNLYERLRTKTILKNKYGWFALLFIIMKPRELKQYGIGTDKGKLTHRTKQRAPRNIYQYVAASKNWQERIYFMTL